MGLANVNIVLTNGALGRVAPSNDGVAGMVLTGMEVAGKLVLNKVYQLSRSGDLATLGVTEENNALVSKEVKAFYAQAGEGAELYVLVVSRAMTLTGMCADPESGGVSPVKTLINYGRGRIRLLGLNRYPELSYVPTLTEGIDADVTAAADAMRVIAGDYEREVNPIRVLLPALFWDETQGDLYVPRAGQNNRVGFVLAADRLFETVKEDKSVVTFASGAVGQVLGRAASISVHQSIARVKNGAIAQVGWMTNGKTPVENAGLLSNLNDAGYIFYRSFMGRNGYFLNDDAMGAPVTDDYSNLNLGRVIDKALILVYTTYVDEIMDNIEVDASGKVPQALCSYYEGRITNAVAVQMNGEISDFAAYINPAQNVLSTSRLEIVCKIVPKGTLREINVSLGFENPALKQ